MKGSGSYLDYEIARIWIILFWTNLVLKNFLQKITLPPTPLSRGWVNPAPKLKIGGNKVYATKLPTETNLPKK